MFDCILYSISPERSPTQVEAWAALEAKSETMAADLVQQSRASQPTKRRRTRQRTILVAAALASALAVYLAR
jgi:hypothetical protein